MNKPPVIVGQTYRVTRSWTVVIYAAGKGMWKLQAGDTLTVTAWPYTGPWPKYATGGREQWCDAKLSTGQPCGIWNLSYLEPVDDGEPIDTL